VSVSIKLDERVEQARLGTPEHADRYDAVINYVDDFLKDTKGSSVKTT